MLCSLTCTLQTINQPTTQIVATNSLINLLFLYFLCVRKQDERLHELIDAVRGRYKAILSMLNLPDTLSSPLSPPPPSTIATQTKLNIQPESLQF